MTKDSRCVCIRSPEWMKPSSQRISSLILLFRSAKPSLPVSGVSTDIVAERFKAGESADELANDYGCAREKIEEAIRCELTLAEAA